MRTAVRERRPMHDVPAPTQAALLCKEGRFRRFLAETGRALVLDEDQAKRAIYELCGIASRSELVPGSAARAVWGTLFTDYELWRHGYDEPGSYSPGCSGPLEM